MGILKDVSACPAAKARTGKGYDVHFVNLESEGDFLLIKSGFLHQIPGR